MPYLPSSMRAEDLKPLGPPVRPAAAVAAPCQHQWVPVPDSKVHSRCAACGVVTLTEMVHVPPAPKPPVCWPFPMVISALALMWRGFLPGDPPSDMRVDLIFRDGTVGEDYASNLVMNLGAVGWRPAAAVVKWVEK